MMIKSVTEFDFALTAVWSSGFYPLVHAQEQSFPYLNGHKGIPCFKRFGQQSLMCQCDFSNWSGLLYATH